ncbi:protocadherin Fat 4-like [Mercenaria mercenaria]|uniref:protocadherin Fat 4-like n=1 Tax=Mercenaria mercenaria TaxID=6596 RepID=UPI00234ECA0F|nr:protocadherin Fat 4-like [Mercenaria mercenaria]
MNITLKCMNKSTCEDFIVSQTAVQGTGAILVLVQDTSLLDYEKRKHIKITVVATETANKTHIAEAVINIAISDVNDNNPKFNNTSYTLYVKENSLNGAKITRITATDADISSKYNSLSYSISGGNGRFNVDTNTGDILVDCSDCTAELDREKQNVYYMTYTAKDVDGRSDSASLVVQLLDVNDNTPVFLSSSYKVIADENDDKYVSKTPLIKVEAHDNDKEGTNNSAVVYDIANTSVANFEKNLTIKPNTGEVHLKSTLDYEKLVNSSGVIYITVQAKDNGKPRRSSSVTVTLNVQDMNDNKPTFKRTLYNATIREDATSNETHYTLVKQVFATDDDGTERNNELNYIIIRGGSDRFTINATSGWVSVQLGARFDRETDSNYNLTIFAIDQGYPPRTGTTTLSIDVTDVNDVLPEFSEKEYSASVKENAGSLSIVKNCPASDDDLNDILKYSISNITASDEKGMKVNQSLVSNYFDIYPNNGTVYVKNKPDRETAEKIILTIMVEDTRAFHPKPQNASAKLTITLEDVNDNNPEFKNKSYSFSVVENSRNGTILGTLKATDKDVNRTITYKMTKNGGSTNGSFKIDPNTGVLSKTGYLDRETNSMAYLQVTATDNGIPPRNRSIGVNVTVDDFNDNSPVFVNFARNVTIKEDSTNGTDVITVNATDKDEGPNKDITYTMDADSHFEIDKSSGIITVVQSLDRETKDTYKLHIIAKDNPVDQKEQKSTDTTVTVNIDDVNDNCPNFKRANYSKRIQEDIDVDTLVIIITATDKDKGNNSVITYEIDDSLNSPLFSIIEITGGIYVKSSLANKVGNYNLTIIAYDQGIPRLNGTANVVIEVTDVNSHNPVITKIPNGNEISVYECADIGTEIHTFSYTDKDFSKDNNQANFSIISEGNKTIAFSITQTGVLKVKSKLDVNNQSKYTFSIQATDNGSPQLSSRVVPITVRILDVNDHLPSFDKAKVTWSKPENTTFIEKIGTVTAYDKDRDSRMCYKIIKSNWTDYFNISEHNGEIFCVKELDHEAVTSISFKVNVTDCSLEKNTTYCNKNKTADILRAQRGVRETIEVVVNVKDIDDSPPVFKQKNLATGMRRNTEADTELELNLRMISDSEDEFFKSLDIDNISNTVVNNAIYQTDISMVAENDAEYEQNVINYYIATSDLRSVDSEVHPTNKSTVDEKATAIDNAAAMVDDSKVVEIAEGLIDSIFVENATENAADQTDYSMVIEIEADYDQSIINYYTKTQNAKDKCSVDENAEYLTDNSAIIENEADYQERVISYYIATQDTDCDKNVINVASRKQCNDDDMCRGQSPKPKRKNWRKKPTRKKLRYIDNENTTGRKDNVDSGSESEKYSSQPFCWTWKKKVV